MLTLGYYLGLLILTFGLIVLARRHRQLDSICILLVWLVLTLFAGLRVGVGRDYFVYINAYTDPSSPSAMFFEYSWRWFNHLCRDVLGLSTHAWMLLIAGATYAIMFVGFRRWQIPWTLGVPVYMAIHQGYFYSLSGVRQALAMAIVFVALAWLRERRWMRYALLGLLATLTHGSAGVIVALAPLLGLPWRRSVLIGGTLILAVGGGAIFELFVEGLSSVIPARYVQYFTMEGIATEQSSGAVFYFLNLLALGLAFSLERQTSPWVSLPTKLFIISVWLYNIFMTFEPGLRLVNYGYLMVIPIVYTLWQRQILVYRLSACLILGGFGAIGLKDLTNPNEPFVRYEIILDRTLPPGRIPHEKL